MSKRLERLPSVQARTGLCTSEIYRLMREGLFPKSIALSKQSRAWVSEEIDAWINAKIAAGRAVTEAA
jgi:prophage regulatory protein